MSNYINNTPVNSLYGRSISGTTNQPFVEIYLSRDPDVTDYQYYVQQRWYNTATDTEWILKGFNSAGAFVIPIWVKIGSASLTETLTGNVGGAVHPTANNINVVGDGIYITTVGNPATSTLTIEPTGGIAILFTENVGTASAMAGNLNVFGAQGVSTTGSGNTVTVVGTPTVAAASSSKANLGTASFNNANFSVDSNGFVSALAQAFNYTNVTNAMSPYTVLSTDYYISVDCSGGAVTLDFPNAPTTKQLWVVKDRLGDSSKNNITLTTAGGVVTFDGATSYSLASNYSSVNLLFNGTNYEIY